MHSLVHIRSHGWARIVLVAAVLITVSLSALHCAPAPQEVVKEVTVPVFVTVPVPITVIAWHTVEVPVTIVAVQTVQVPITVEVVHTSIVTVDVPVTVTPPPQQAATAAVAAPTPAPAPTVVPAPQVHPYLAIARAQNTQLFNSISALDKFKDPPNRPTNDWQAAAITTLTAEAGRIVAVRTALEAAPSPPLELASAHNLMLQACDFLDLAIQGAWAGEPVDSPMDRAYERNIEAQAILKQYAGE